MPLLKANQLESYFVAGTQDLATEQTLPHLLEAAIQAGITAFQYREKGRGSLQTPSAIHEMALRLQSICHKNGVLFIINDDLELALSIQADGVHVGQNDQKIQTVIEKAAGQLIIGLSCHHSAEIQVANQYPEISYIGVGPVFNTNSKDDAKAPLGVTRLHELADVSNKPVVAIGGLNTQNILAINPEKITGLAIISTITQAKDLNETVRLLREPFNHSSDFPLQ